MKKKTKKKRIKPTHYYFLRTFKNFEKDDIEYFNKMMGHPEEVERKEDDSFEISGIRFEHIPQIGNLIKISELVFVVKDVVFWYDDNMVLDEICIEIEKTSDSD